MTGVTKSGPYKGGAAGRSEAHCPARLVRTGVLAAVAIGVDMNDSGAGAGASDTLRDYCFHRVGNTPVGVRDSMRQSARVQSKLCALRRLQRFRLDAAPEVILAKTVFVEGAACKTSAS